MPVFDKSGSLNSGAYYYLKTGMIASVLTYYRIDVKKLYEGLVREYSISPEQIIKHEGYHKAIEKCRIQAAYIQLSDSIILYMNTLQAYVEVFHNCSTHAIELEKVESIIIDHIKKITEERKVGLIVTDSTGALDVREFTITDTVDDISALYNDDFLEFNVTLIEKLQQKPSRGLVLLHGAPGTGKSTYIRHLIGSTC